MQDLFQNEYRTRYIIVKILDYLPGTSSEIIDDLSKLLYCPSVSLSSERAKQLKQIQSFLTDNETATITRHSIQEKIAALKNSTIPTTKMHALMNFVQNILERIKYFTVQNKAVN